MTTDRRI